MNPQQAKGPPTYTFLRPYFQPCLSQSLQSFEGLAKFPGVNTTLAMDPVQRRRALDPIKVTIDKVQRGNGTYDPR